MRESLDVRRDGGNLTTVMPSLIRRRGAETQTLCHSNPTIPTRPAFAFPPFRQQRNPRLEQLKWQQPEELRNPVEVLKLDLALPVQPLIQPRYTVVAP